MKRQLDLEYSLGSGWLSTWLDGLRRGRAVASTCSTCGDARFPPLSACPTCRSPSDGWRRLDGGASILFRTTGKDGDFALVQFDGATGGAIARAHAIPTGAQRCRLAASEDEPPTLSLIAEPKT